MLTAVEGTLCSPYKKIWKLSLFRFDEDIMQLIASSHFSQSKNPDYLKRNNYLLYTSWKSDAPAMNPLSVNWDSVDGKNFPYRIVQQPGDNNALGQVKFLFPNRFHVYLHDTQAKELFSRNSRANSGTQGMEYCSAKALARFVLPVLSGPVRQILAVVLNIYSLT